jgi:protein farnesyltransferase/geranylgeranyltransferase type-1 subunit alpha
LQDCINAEIETCKSYIEKSPGNESPWNYLVGILNYCKVKLDTIKPFCLQLVSKGVCSAHVYSALVDICEESGDNVKAAEYLKLLAGTIDPVRKRYWELRLSMLNK